MTTDVVEIGPTVFERYTALRKNAEIFVEHMAVMIATLERDGKMDEATNLKVWAMMPWQAALRDDESGDLWPICEICGKPIKNDSDLIGGDADFHRQCINE